MTTNVALPVAPLHAVPEVRLLDARAAGLDEQGLRACARAMTDGCGMPHVARSYRYPFALVAWHQEPVGVDLERIDRCDAAFANLICTPRERTRPRALADSDPYLTSLWCSKEALAKALGDALSYDPSRLDSPVYWPDLRSGPWRATPLETVPQHAAWLCWRSSSDERRAPSGIPITSVTASSRDDRLTSDGQCSGRRAQVRI